MYMIYEIRSRDMREGNEMRGSGRDLFVYSRYMQNQLNIVYQEQIIPNFDRMYLEIHVSSVSLDVYECTKIQ